MFILFAQQTRIHLISPEEEKVLKSEVVDATSETGRLEYARLLYQLVTKKALQNPRLIELFLAVAREAETFGAV
jgi:hypothetical protein